MDEDDKFAEEELREKVYQNIQDSYEAKEAALPEATMMRQLEKQVMLQHLDMHWKEHLGNMDHLRQSIHLRSYAQKNPKQEYKREAFELFSGCWIT